jgi:hypothetical protein
MTIYNKFNLFGSIFKYMVIKNDTDADIKVTITIDRIKIHVCYISYNNKRPYRISLKQEPSYMTINTIVSNERIILARDVAINNGRLYKIKKLVII